MCAWVRSYGFIRTLPYQRFSPEPLLPPRVVYWGVVSPRTFFWLQETDLVPWCPRVSPSWGCCAARARGLGAGASLLGLERLPLPVPAGLLVGEGVWGREKL